jgi:hypothetical protein
MLLRRETSTYGGTGRGDLLVRLWKASACRIIRSVGGISEVVVSFIEWSINAFVRSGEEANHGTMLVLHAKSDGAKLPVLKMWLLRHI